jgi:hypothetical protein
MRERLLEEPRVGEPVAKQLYWRPFAQLPFEFAE